MTTNFKQPLSLAKGSSSNVNIRIDDNAGYLILTHPSLKLGVNCACMQSSVGVEMLYLFVLLSAHLI